MSAPADFGGALRFAADLIRIPSPPGGEGEVAARVRAEMETLGYDEVRVDDVGNVVGIVRGRGEAPPVMLSCHLDAVDPGDPEAWDHPPFSGSVEDGFLHGRGAMDIKGPLAIQTYAAVEAARHPDGPPAGDVVVAHTVLEERGGWGMAHLLESGAVGPGAVIIGESTHGDVAIGHRGRAELEVTVGGAAGHASAPERARNALEGIPGVLAALARIAAELPRDPVLGASSLAATGVDVRPASRNVIPDEATVVVDWRTLPGMDDEGLLRRVAAAVDAGGGLPEGLRLDVDLARERQRCYTGVEEERALHTPGFLLDADHPVVRAALRAVREGTGEEPAARPWTFATDGGHAAGVHGIPTVGFAPGEERFAHTNRERLDVEEARRALAVYPDVIRAVQAAVG